MDAAGGGVSKVEIREESDSPVTAKAANGRLNFGKESKARDGLTGDQFIGKLMIERS